ncbi:hypothetical protein PF005_g24289 [Phytophthora fragariae]|uniref:Uncharacterized protein n=1 Tax=Phytophthora fragariae TaxID=53985 RepID=A0A6A3QJT2_9STRA|nr:hypothetical protein PF003_g13813 [Phytophthora fragariae]KAE8927048.1 hypothetical protein PF009_g22775 [Phytophthora fragariae]KAE9077315.1 hypothetical protein PF007_g24289 [Phytophthora fragariae]KAE9108487.1 hypothetical protein PF006_g20869 [Phytophthora fragariae]KAE9177940.1 hypothetical protein PF005_g24289 [Phytophthora fragariae]
MVTCHWPRRAALRPRLRSLPKLTFWLSAVSASMSMSALLSSLSPTSMGNLSG